VAYAEELRYPTKTGSGGARYCHDLIYLQVFLRHCLFEKILAEATDWSDTSASLQIGLEASAPQKHTSCCW